MTSLPQITPHAVMVASEVLGERARQTELFGVQTLPDGTGQDRAQVYAAALRTICDGDEVTWAAVLLEEVAEAMAEKSGSPNLRTELVQVSAVCQQWVEAIDRRNAEEKQLAESRRRSGLQWGPGRGLTSC